MISRAGRRRLLRRLLRGALPLIVFGACAASACSSGGTPSGGGTGGGSGGAVGSGGSPGAGGAGTGAGGAHQDGGSGGVNGGGGVSGSGGSSGGSGGGTVDAGAGGAGGAAGCAGRAVSLSRNGTALDSDAARARVVIDLGSDLPIRNANRTVEFWAFIKTTDWRGERNEIYVYGSPGTTATAFGLDFGTNEVPGMAGNHATLNPYTNGGFNDDTDGYLGITSATDQWVHIAMTWDGTAVRTYVNGTLRITTMGTGGLTALATAATPLTLGCNDPIFNCFNGDFDEVRVWSVARNATQIMDSYNKPLAGNEAGLVGYWKFDEAPGATSVADSVTTAGHTPHPGTLTSAIAGSNPTLIVPAPPVPLVCL